MTTFTSYVTALSGLTVSGVTRKYTSPPQSINTADLPAQWPLLPSGDAAPLVFGGYGSPAGTYRCDLVIATEAVGQNVNSVNFAGVLTLMDALTTALKAMTRPVAGAFTWTIRQAIVTVAGNDYWALICSCEGSG